MRYIEEAYIYTCVCVCAIHRLQCLTRWIGFVTVTEHINWYMLNKWMNGWANEQKIKWYIDDHHQLKSKIDNGWIKKNKNVEDQNNIILANSEH